jgi:hypothetical protein
VQLLIPKSHIMTIKFLSRFDSDNLRKTMVYLGISILLIIASLFFGITKGNSFAVILVFIGCVMFFYGVLHPCGKPLYYLILVLISIIILILLFKVGIGILVKIESTYQIPGRWAENMGWTIGEVCVAAFIAGIIGALRFRKYD